MDGSSMYEECMEPCNSSFVGHDLYSILQGWGILAVDEPYEKLVIWTYNVSQAAMRPNCPSRVASTSKGLVLVF
jgi:hypothetical protein